MKLIVFALFLGVAFAAESPGPPLPDGRTAGRFALFSAGEKGFFRIDTATGKTWKMLEIIVNGGPQIEGWSEVDEDVIALHERVKPLVKPR